MTNPNIVGIAAYGNFGAKAGNDPSSQANDFKNWLTAIGEAGFNFLLMSTFHVDAQGNLNDTAPVAKDGIFNPELNGPNPDPSDGLNPQLPMLLADFKSTYNAKVYYSIGNAAGTASDMANLSSILGNYSCTPGSTPPDTKEYNNLVANMKLLKSDLHIDGIDFDFEPATYDSAGQTLVSQFTCLCNSLGFGVTYDPYYPQTQTQMPPTFWLDAQANACDPTNSGTGTQKVDWWNLQCYSGGQGNTASAWTGEIDSYQGKDRLGISDTSTFVIPGYSQDSKPSTVQQEIYESATGTPVANGGGWIWQLGQFDLKSPNLESDLREYAQAIINGQTSPTS